MRGTCRVRHPGVFQLKIAFTIEFSNITATGALLPTRDLHPPHCC